MTDAAMRWIRNAKGRAAYIGIGDGHMLARELNFLPGWRGMLEQMIIRLSPFLPPCRPLRSPLPEAIRAFESSVGAVESGLFFASGHYKPWHGMGPAVLKNGARYFIKLHQSPVDCADLTRRHALLQARFSDVFRLAPPVLCQGGIAAYELIPHGKAFPSQLMLQKLALHLSLAEAGKEKTLNQLDLPLAGLAERFSGSVKTAYEQLLREPLEFLPAHGDLTRWNCFYDREGRLCLVDEERAGDYPLFYDYFHCVLQPRFLKRAPIFLTPSSAVAGLAAASLSVEQRLSYLAAYLAIQCAIDARTLEQTGDARLHRVVRRKRKFLERALRAGLS